MPQPGLAAFLLSRGDAVELRVRVQPRARRDQIRGVLGDELKVSLTAPPVDGAANTALRKFFARLFGLALRDIELVAGAASRSKRLRLHGISEDAVLRIIRERLP